MATKKDISKLSNRFRILEKGFKTTIQTTNEALAKKLEDEITFNHAVYVATLPPNDPQDHSIVVYSEYNTAGDKVLVRAAGNQIIYDEFGTGDKGAANPHPEKNKYNLNDYNSGPFIREDKYGRHYWFYKNQITNGVPAGAFIYKSLNNVRRDAPKIIKEKIKKSKDDWIL